MSVKLLTKHHLEFLRLKGGCTGSSESTPVKMPHCWKLHVAAHLTNLIGIVICLSLAGRPFIVELTNPHRVSFTQEEITKIQTLANSATKDIFIRDLQIVSR